jgi:hypothetical protein
MAAMWIAWLMRRLPRSDSRWTFRFPDDTSTATCSNACATDMDEELLAAAGQAQEQLIEADHAAEVAK